jgi:glycosyltransferase involved in cell wall biosynthesis
MTHASSHFADVLVRPATRDAQRQPSLAVVIPVADRFDDPAEVFRAYRAGLKPVAPDAEFIYVLDGPRPEVSEPLEALRDSGAPIRIITLPRPFGEASALSVGFQNSTSPLILTLPPYYQVEPSALPEMFDSLGKADLVVASRDRSADLLLNRIQGRLFRDLARFSGARFSDLGCSVRLIRADVARAINMYGEQHRFLPVLAESRGYRVAQITLQQHENDRRMRTRRPSTFIERLLDLGTLYFLLRFTLKPFRFFGSLGLAIAALGLLVGLALSFQKLAYDLPLADRPALILAVLLIVLGVQVTAVGLIGEIVVFTRAKSSDDLLIEAMIRSEPTGRDDADVAGAEVAVDRRLDRQAENAA